MFLLVIALVAIAIAIFLYRKDSIFEEISKQKRIFLTTLRAIFIFLILALLLNPLIKHRSNEILKPIVVIAQDDSKSIVYTKDSAYYQGKYLEKINELAQDLSSNCEVKIMPFSSNMRDDLDITFDGDKTDIANVFSEISSRFAGSNLGAVILATDGIYNYGQNPYYLKSMNYPVYCIAMGDTSHQKDILIKDAIHNNVVFLGNKFPVRIAYSSEKCQESVAQLTVFQDGKTVVSTKIDIVNSQIQMIDLEIPAEKVGTSHYRAVISHLKDEINFENNEFDFFVDVIDKRNKMMLISEAPHPDVGAICSALKNNPDIELEVKYADDKNISLNECSLVIFNQLPSEKHPVADIFAQADKKSIPRIFILGTQTSYPLFDKQNTSFKTNVYYNSYDEALPIFNSNFSTFAIENPDYFRQLSPLESIYGKFSFLGETKVLLTQKINGIETDRPMIALSERDGRKECFIVGEGLWKWRLDDYRFNSTHDNFNSLINKLVQFTMQKQLEENFVVNAKHIYDGSENVVITAEFYDDTYSLVPELEVKLSVSDSTGTKYDYVFDPSGQTYRIDLGKMSSGKYSCEASIVFDGNEFKKSKSFFVRNLNRESMSLSADHRLLAYIAEETGGVIYDSKDFSHIKDEILQHSNVKKVIYQHEKISDISDLWMIFFIILLFATTEWFFRKFWGGY